MTQNGRVQGREDLDLNDAWQSRLYVWRLPFVANRPERRKNARFQDLGLGSYPVFKCRSLGRTALIVKLARPHPDLSLQHAEHEFLALAGYLFNLHDFNPLQLTFILQAELLQEGEGRGYLSTMAKQYNLARTYV